MHIKNTYKNRKPYISLEKKSEIIIKITTKYYKQKKSIFKIAR